MSKIVRAFPVFSIAFAIFYAWGISLNNTILFYYPKIGRWNFGRLPRTPEIGVASQLYGWIGDAVLGALIVAVIYLAIPQRLLPRTWSGWSWVIPLAMWLVAINVIVHLYWLPVAKS
jgi:hypothetical protein